MHFFGFVCYSGSLWVDFNISKKVFRQNFVILNNIQIKTLEVMFIYIYIYIYIYKTQSVKYDSACLQKYTTCKGFRCFFYFKSHKSSNNEDVITIPWYDLQR